MYCRVLFSFWISSSIYFPNYNALKTVNCCNQFWSNNYLFMKSCMPITTNAQNFYVLKIHLNSVKISNHVLIFENLFEICKSFISPEKIFQTWTLWSGATMWVYSSFSCDRLKYTHMAPVHMVHVWNKFSDGIKRFQI